MKECHIEPHTRFDTAVQSFKANPSTWDILISDLVLPEKSGAELARFCKELNPDISTLLITGYPTDQLENYSENFDIPVLQKPFMSDKIMQEIHNILHANKGKNLA
jgi:DNA-binding NtrC family response regulator